MADGASREVKGVVVEAEAGEAAGDHRAAVVTAVPADDLLLLWLAFQVVVVPHELHVGFVGIRARHAIEDLAHVARRHGDQTVR